MQDLSKPKTKPTQAATALTSGSSEFDRAVRATPHGMFFWSGTSADPGATCGGCQHFKTEHQNSIRGCCGKVRTRKNGATFDRRTPACKYFEITEREEARRAGATPEALHRRDPMDLRKYAGSSFVGLDDVRGGPIREEVVDAVDGEFEKL
jgi:hypothetical protein